MAGLQKKLLGLHGALVLYMYLHADMDNDFVADKRICSTRCKTSLKIAD